LVCSLARRFPFVAFCRFFFNSTIEEKEEEEEEGFQVSSDKPNPWWQCYKFREI
jgi:hypothetical protein